MATGTVGTSLKGHGDPGVFLSTDAGLNWRQVSNSVLNIWGYL